MPQDGLRSAIYRSFVTCNDPKGVVTCRTIRRYEANCPHKMEDNRETISQRKMRSLNAPGPEAIITASREDVRSPASFQLVEVSRGAQKLNKMIERWSGGQSKDIAKDLLKGAMDLQDSLLMLGKLQEASRYMARLKRERTAMESGVGRPRSDHQKAGDGSSTEELKNVIRESLVKHSSVSTKKAAREVESASTSESPLGQSSSSARRVTGSHRAAAKGPNLIAKLMGLEEYPSKPFSDIDASRVRRPQCVAQKANPERRSLREILEGVRFEGPDKCNNAATDSEKKLIGEGPPIVLIKPLRVPCSEPEETCRSAALEEEDPLYRRAVLRKLRESEELQPKKVVEYRGGDLKPDRKLGKPEAEATRRKGTSGQRATVEVPEDKRVVAKANSSAVKRGEKVQKATNVNGNSLEKKTKSVVVTSEDQAIRASIKERKTGSEATILKSQNPRRSSPSPPKPSPIKRADQAASSHQKKSYMKKEKPAKKPAVAKAIETSGREEGEKRTGLCSGSDYLEVTINTDPETQVADNSESKIEDVTGRQSSLFEPTPSTPCPNHEHHGEPAEEEAPIDIKVCEPEGSLKALLMSSPSFQNRAEELFDLNINGSGASRASLIDEFGDTSSAKLLLDCANELIERRSFRDPKTVDPRRRVSMETLAKEVCSGIEALRSYAELSGERLIADYLYAMLERDVMCRGAASGVWDCGWRTGFSSDDAERVVSDVEKLVLSGLIEEVFL